MFEAWVISPVEEVVKELDGNGKNVRVLKDPNNADHVSQLIRRRPRAANIIDPGRPVDLPQGRRTYGHGSSYSDQNWCISKIRGVDITALLNDPLCIVLAVDGQDDVDIRISAKPKAYRDKLKGFLRKNGMVYDSQESINALVERLEGQH